MSVVKINALTVSQEMRETLERRFAARAGVVDSSDGFEWFELLRPVEGTDQYLVYTRWRSEEDYQRWASTSMRASHGDAGGGDGAGDGAPKPRPAASDSALWSFEVVQQSGPKSD